MVRGVRILVLAVLMAAVGATSAYADGTTGTTTPTPAYARLSPSFLPESCVGAGAAAIVVPGTRVLALGTPASPRGPSAYPATAPVVAFGSASASASGATCKTASITLESVSLFGGLVTATSVAATHGNGTVTGLQVAGSPVTLAAGQTALLGDWGEVTSARTVGRLTAPLAVVLFAQHGSLPAGTTVLIGFAAAPEPTVRAPKHQNPTSSSSGGTHHHTKTTPSSSTSSKTQAAPAHTATKAKKHRHRKRHVPQPLTAVPSLGYKPGHYVFPVNGGASYSDTYGGVRNDIYDGWHHGDDLFASLGTPVVAVATGKLSLVGWNQLGGWRLWLTDGRGNSFYYAHLAGYSRWILDHPNVKAGQVIGFLGRTGDAFTTAPHLHFEIHPQLYLRLGYDGAVDPTTYLKKWRTVWVPKNEMPQPAKLKAPVGAPSQEASVVWHELLAARHLLGPSKSQTRVISAPERPISQLRILEAAVGPSRIAGFVPTAAHVSTASDTTVWWGSGTGGALAIAALSAGAFLFRRRRRPAPETAAPETSG